MPAYPDVRASWLPPTDPSIFESPVTKAVGIPGIKYLDQGSRTAGEGTRNYVVFDDRLVSIVKKYMLAGLTLDAAVQRAVAEEETAQ